MVDWGPLKSELAAWRAERRAPTFWWRDDDAVAVTPELEILIEIAHAMQVPAHLAIIPKFLEETLVAKCQADPLLTPLVHGWSHENRAPLLQKKAEFGHPRSDLKDDAQRGLERMSDAFGSGFVPCFVPPWNRIAADLIPDLPGLGYTCVSTFTPRRARLAAPDLVQINTHVDPIFWRGNRGLGPAGDLIEQAARFLKERRLNARDDAEPLGLLTHHLVQTEEVWAFVRAFLSVLLDEGAVPVNLFDLRDDLP